MAHKNIHVLGKRWRDTNGNTYHTATVYVDGAFVGVSPVTYGYGSHYEHTAAELLQCELPHYPNGAQMTLRRWCEENGHTLISEAVDVQRKKDL